MVGDVSGRAVWFGLWFVWVVLWFGLAVTDNAAFAIAAGGLALAGSIVLSTNYRGAARWFWLRYQRSSWTRGLDLRTIQLVGRFFVAIAGVIVVSAVAKLIAG
jgi:hypothetical protein